MFNSDMFNVRRCILWNNKSLPINKPLKNENEKNKEIKNIHFTYLIKKNKNKQKNKR